MLEKFSEDSSLLEMNHLLHIFLNLFQSAYPIKEVLLSHLPKFGYLEEKLNDNLYNALILIIHKLMQPNNLPLLKEKTIEQGLDFEEIIELEMLIMNKLNWKIYLQTPDELITLLISDINSLNIYDEKHLNDIYTSCMDLINHCFSDYTIYLNFDQFVISISSFIICLENYSEECLLNEFKSFLLDNIKQVFTFQNIHNCKLYLENKLSYYNNDELKNLTEDLNEAKLDSNENKISDNSLNNSEFSTLDNEKNRDAFCIYEDPNKNCSTIDFDDDINQRK